jgi:hypothetical protein
VNDDGRTVAAMDVLAPGIRRDHWLALADEVVE